MATEADVPETISIATGEGADRSLKTEKLDRTDDQCSPGTLNESKGDLDQHPEIHSEKHFADCENVQVEYSMEVESKNNSFGNLEGEHFLDPPSEISQVEQANQAGMEIPKNEVQLQKVTQVGGPLESGTEENEVIEERNEKFAEDTENHDGARIISEITKTEDAKLDFEEVEASTNDKTVDQHIQVISNQQDSIKEDVQCLEKKAEISDADIRGAENADGNAESYHKEASGLLEATAFQEYESSIHTHDVTNNSFNKDVELETNVTSNDEEDSQQTFQNYEQKEELQALPEVRPEDAKTELAFANAEVISCTEEEREIQNTPEFSEKEEANPVDCPKQNDSITEEDSEATSIEQETVEHAALEIQTAENQPQEFRKENSRDYQASVEAAHLSTNKDEKNLEDQAIQEKFSSLVEEETQQISREEVQPVQATNLKEKEKEADTKCEQPEVADTTTEIGFETIVQRTETNKDLYVPIPEEETYAKESTKEFVEDNSFLSDVSEVTTKEVIQEDHSTVSGYGLESGEVSQVSALEEAEAENKEHVNNTPEQKGLQTIITDETVVETEDHAQAGESYNSETIEKDNQRVGDEGKADAGIAPAEGLATIIPDQPTLHIEDIELKAEENVNSKDKLEDQIPAAADGGKGLIEVQTENNEHVTDTDITSEEKVPETSLTDDTALDSKDIDIQEERDLSSEENLEKQLPVVEDKGDTCFKEAEEKEQKTLPTIVTREPPLGIEVIDVQAEESFSPKEKLEELIPAVADEDDTGSKEAKEENKEQVKSTDNAPEEKVTFLTDERALDSEEVELQVEENVDSKDSKKQIPTTAEKGDAGLKGPEEDRNEPVSIIDISPEEKGLATILTYETTQNAEDTDVKAAECINSKEIETENFSKEPQEENEEKVAYTHITPEEKIVNLQEQLEEQVQVVADEGDICLNEAEEENKENINSKETSPEEKGLPIISSDETALDSDKIELQSEENVSSTDNLEKHIPTPADEAECGWTEVESEYKEQATIINITPEVESVPAIWTDQTALESEETELRAEEDVTSTDYLGKEIPTTADEGEDILREAKAESKEQITITDITQEKGVETISTDERSLETEDANVQAKESANSNENLEEISAAPELGDTYLKKENKEENKEQVESSSHEEKGLATILTEETSQDLEYTDARETFNSEEILEMQIPAAVYKGETDMNEVEAENKEHETTEIALEEKGLPTIFAHETAEGIEVIDVQEKEINSKEVLEKQIPTALDEGETCLKKENEEENKYQVESRSHEEKGLATILTEEASQDLEYTDARENFNSEEILEKQIPTTVYEGETDLREVEAENKEQVETTEIATEEKGLPTILVDETAEGIEVIGVQEGKINLKEVLEKQIPTALDEGETDLKEAEADIKEKVETADIVPDQKGVETILSDERALDLEDVHVQEQENLNLNENLESQIPTMVGEGETDLNEGEVENEVECTEIVAEMKDVTTILRDETALAIQDVEVKAEGQSEAGKAGVLDDIPVNVHNTEPVDEATVEQTYEEPSHKDAEPKIAVEDEKSEDNTEGDHMIVEEVLDEPKITSRDFNEEQIIEGHLESSKPESIEEDTIKSSQHNEKETIELKEEGSCTGNTNEENASDHIKEYIPEDAAEHIKDEDYNVVKSENKILEDSQTIEVDETCETKNIEKSEKILSTLPVKYDEGQQGEGCSPAPTEAFKEDNIIEVPLSVQVAKDDDNSGAVTNTETSAQVPSNEEDSPEVLQNYELEEEITKFPDVKPEETTPGSSSENVEVITCTKEETKESLNISSGEVLETTTTKALPEIQIVEDTAETATKLQVCAEAAELSTEGEKENSEEQTTCEVSSSLIVEKSEESSKKEKNEGHVDCKDSIEEANSDTLDDTAKQKPIQEEESNKSFVDDNSFSLEASEKEIGKEIHGEYSSTVRSFDSEVVADETGLTEATTEDKELFETTQNAPQEKGNEGIDVSNTEVVGVTVQPSFQEKNLEEEATTDMEVVDETEKSADLLEKNSNICEEVADEHITKRDFSEITEGNVTNLTTEPVVEHETVKNYQGEEKETEKLNEEESYIENITEGKANDISTESAEDKDENLKECIEETVESKEQMTAGNVEIFIPEIVEEDTIKNSEDSEKETVELKDVGSCTESIKEENASELSPEYKEDALKSEEILEDSQTVGVNESSTCQTLNVETSEETVCTLPVVQLLLQVQENIHEDTISVQETKEGDDGAVTVTKTCAEAPSNDEESPQVLQKSEPEEEFTKLQGIPPEEMKPESSSENAEVVTCSETQESLDIEKDTKESGTSTGEACIEAAELRLEGEKEEQTTHEVSSSPKEEKKEAHEESKEASEVTEDGSISSEASDKASEKKIQGEYSSTVRSFDSEVVSDEKGLTEAREQVETTQIAPTESEGTDIYNTELVKESIVEPSTQVQTHAEVAEPISKDETEKSYDHPEKSDKTSAEVLDKPKISDRDSHEEQIITEEIVREEETVKDQADENERKSSNEVSSIVNIQEGNAKDISTECVPEVIVEECIGEAVESKEEVLEESQTDDRDDETFQIKEAGHNDDYNGTLVLTETKAEVASTGEESSEVKRILELGDEHAQVEASDLADESRETEVCKLEEKVSVAERTEEVTSGEVEVSNLALEHQNSDATEEETIESCEVVPESSKGINVVAEDEVTVDQKLDEGVSKEPSTLLSEEQELSASEHEQTKEVEVPTEEDKGDLLAARSAKDIRFPEEQIELKVSELAPEKLATGETEETKETSETVTISDPQSIGAVCEDEIITDEKQCEGEKELGDSELVQETLHTEAPDEETKDGAAVAPKLDSESIDELVKEEVIVDQTLPEGISTEQLQIPSTVLLPEEKELEASEYVHETESVDKNIEEENPKGVEVPADEYKQESFAATPTETCLHTEEPRDTESAVHKLDAGETEEEIKETSETVTKSDSQSIIVASGDEIVADQTLCEEKTEKPLSQERELGASELALEKLAAVDIEEIKEGPEVVPKFDSGLIEVLSSDEITIDETFNEGIIKEKIQSPSSRLLPEEKEHETSEPEHETTAQDRSTEQECTKDVEVSADEDTQGLLATRPVEKECLQKEEPGELNLPELALEKLDAGDTEESHGTFETVSTSEFPSIVADSKEEITVDETVSKGITDIPLDIPSYASELHLEKLDADTPEEVKGSEVIPQPVSQSSCEVSKDEILADKLEIPSSALLSDEKELKASEHEHETIIDEKNQEDENLKEMKEPTDEASEYVFVGRSVEETCLQKEEPSDLEVPEANEIEEVKKTFETVSESDSQSINAVSKDDAIADQTVSDVITDLPLDIPLPNKNEEVKEDATELALEKLDTDATEEVKNGSEVTPKSDLQSIDVVVNDEVITNQELHESITKEQLLVQSSSLLPEEKELKEIEQEHETATQDKNLEEEYAKETEVAADEKSRDVIAASSEETTHLQNEGSRELKLSPECEEEITETFESTDAVSKEETIAEQLLHQHDEQLQITSPTLLPEEKEEAIVHKEELEDCKVPELPLKCETAEETKEVFETASEVSSQSIGELATDEIVNQIPPSSLTSEETRRGDTTTINYAGEESMNVVEVPSDESRKDTNSAQETSIPNEEPRELNVSDLEFCSNQDMERNSSNQDKNFEVATSDSRAEDSCETTVEANQTAKIEVLNEEIKDEKEVAKNSQLNSVDEENVIESQKENESREEKYPEEKNDTFTAPTDYHHEVPEVDETGGLSRDIEKEVKPDEKSFEDHSPDEAEGMIQETAIHLDQGDGTNCGSSTTEVTYPVEKDSSVEISQGVLGFEEAKETTQATKQLEKESHATDIPRSKDEALNFVQGPKLEDTKPRKDTLVARETKDKFCESGTETADSTSAQISLSERLMDETTKERMKVVTHLSEEKEPTVGKELQADEEEEDHENVDETKTDEEIEDTEHKRACQGYDEPVIVEASRDTEVKVSPKKSHNILLGMGKSVKHSISKVKKAIIGKSSHSKTQVEK